MLSLDSYSLLFTLGNSFLYKNNKKIIYLPFIKYWLALIIYYVYYF